MPEKYNIYLHIKRTRLVEEKGAYILKVHSTREITKEEQSDYFFTKLKCVLDLLAEATGKDVKFEFVTNKNILDKESTSSIDFVEF